MPELALVPHEGIFCVDNRDAQTAFFVNLRTHEKHPLPREERATWALDFDDEGMSFAYCIADGAGHDPIHSSQVFEHEVFMTEGGEEVVVTAGMGTAMRMAHFLSGHALVEVKLLVGPSRCSRALAAAVFARGIGGGHWRWNLLELHKILGLKHGRRTTSLPGRWVAASWPSWSRKVEEAGRPDGLMKSIASDKADPN